VTSTFPQAQPPPAATSLAFAGCAAAALRSCAPASVHRSLPHPRNAHRPNYGVPSGWRSRRSTQLASCAGCELGVAGMPHPGTSVVSCSRTGAGVGLATSWSSGWPA
jgi:hypothetical protein